MKERKFAPPPGFVEMLEKCGVPRSIIDAEFSQAKTPAQMTALMKKLREQYIRPMWRKRALELHPDRGGDEAKFKEANAEYQRAMAAGAQYLPPSMAGNVGYRPDMHVDIPHIPRVDIPTDPALYEKPDYNPLAAMRQRLEALGIDKSKIDQMVEASQQSEQRRQHRLDNFLGQVTGRGRSK